MILGTKRIKFQEFSNKVIVYLELDGPWSFKLIMASHPSKHPKKIVIKKQLKAMLQLLKVYT